MKHFFKILFLTALTACATTHPGYMGHTVGEDQGLPLEVSGRVVSEMSDDYHQFIDFTFENKGPDWIRISQSEFIYGSEEQNKKSNVLVGRDLVTWAEAMGNRRAIEEQNQKVTTAVVGAVGAAAMIGGAASRSNSAMLIGMGVYTAAAIHGVGSEIHSKLLKIETSNAVPDSHFYSPFAVPAGNFIRRWIVVNAPRKSLAKETSIAIKTIDGKTQHYLVQITNTPGKEKP